MIADSGVPRKPRGAAPRTVPDHPATIRLPNGFSERAKV